MTTNGDLNKPFWSYRVEYFNRSEKCWKFEDGVINEPFNKEQATELLKKHFENMSYKIIELKEVQ